MFYLALAVLSSLILAMVFKHAETRNYDRLGLITTNYAVGIGVATIVLALEGRLQETLHFEWTAGFFGLGVFEGVMLVGGLFALAAATRRTGMGVAVGVQRISVIIPFAASWLIFAETPTPFQFGGLALGGVAFFMIARRPRWAVGPVLPAPEVPEDVQPAWHAGAAVILISLFVVGGLVDFGFKVFDEAYSATYSRASFLLIAFSTSCILCGGLLITRSYGTGTRLSLKAVGWGAVVGMANYAAAEFLLRAVSELSGPLVFPAKNISMVIGGAVLGVVIWQERLSLLNKTGLACAALALVLLNL